jgi:FSR family fosmidomycin resistance protein-like MFS transporter
VDGYTSFSAPLLASLAAALGVPYGSISLLFGLTGVSNALSNILGGLATDRWKRSGAAIVISATVLTVVFMSGIGIASSLAMLAVVMLTGSFGCGALHPAAFFLAGEVSHPNRHHGVSVVMAVGICACGLGPLLVTQVVRRGGLRATPWCVVPGLILAATAAWLLRGSSAAAPPAARADPDPAAAPAHNTAIGIGMLFANAVLRAFAHTGIIVIVSYLSENVWGLSVVASGVGIGLLQAGSGLGNLVGGMATRTGGERRAMLVCVPVCLLLLLPMALTTGAAWYVWLFFYGLAINAPSPVVVAMAQRVAPQRGALVSGLMVGPAYAVGGLLASGTTAFLIQRTTQPVTMAFLALPLLLSAFAVWRLR